MMDGEFSNDDWIGSDVGPPKKDVQSTINWLVSSKFFIENLFFFFRIFLTSTFNFSFWTDEDEKESFSRLCQNKLYHGYEAMCVAINQAIRVNIFLKN